MALVAVVFGVGGVILSPVLDVDRVTIRGAGPRAQQVRQIAEVDPGAAILLVDTGAAADRIESLAWVARADVSRVLPGTITIRVTSRAPVAFAARTDGTVAIVDPTGTVVAVEAVAPPGLTELVSTTPDVSLGERIRPLAAARVATALGPLTGRVARTMVERRQAALLMAGGPEVRLGDLDRLRDKMIAADAVLRNLGDSAVTYVDVSVPSAPVTG